MVAVCKVGLDGALGALVWMVRLEHWSLSRYTGVGAPPLDVANTKKLRVDESACTNVLAFLFIDVYTNHQLP